MKPPRITISRPFIFAPFLEIPIRLFCLFCRYWLNIACPYTSSEELEQAQGKLEAADEPFESRLYLNQSNCRYPQIDMLVRTSGEKRLSNFMLYQVTTHPTKIYFIKPFWPQLSFWTFFWLLIDYCVDQVCPSLVAARS